MEGVDLIALLSSGVSDFPLYFCPRSFRRAFTMNTDGLNTPLYFDGDCTDAKESNTHEDERDWPAQ